LVLLIDPGNITKHLRSRRNDQYFLPRSVKTLGKLSTNPNDLGDFERTQVTFRSQFFTLQLILILLLLAIKRAWAMQSSPRAV